MKKTVQTRIAENNARLMSSLWEDNNDWEDSSRNVTCPECNCLVDEGDIIPGEGICSLCHERNREAFESDDNENE